MAQNIALDAVSQKSLETEWDINQKKLIQERITHEETVKRELVEALKNKRNELKQQDKETRAAKPLAERFQEITGLAPSENHYAIYNTNDAIKSLTVTNPNTVERRLMSFTDEQALERQQTQFDLKKGIGIDGSKKAEWVMGEADKRLTPDGLQPALESLRNPISPEEATASRAQRIAEFADSIAKGEMFPDLAARHFAKMEVLDRIQEDAGFKVERSSAMKNLGLDDERTSSIAERDSSQRAAASIQARSDVYQEFSQELGKETAELALPAVVAKQWVASDGQDIAQLNSGPVIREAIDTVALNAESNNAYRENAEQVQLLAFATSREQALAEPSIAPEVVRPVPVLEAERADSEQNASIPGYGVTMIDGKPATSVRFERAEQEGDTAYTVSFHMANKQVARYKELDGEALRDALGDKNAEAIATHDADRGSLKGEELQFANGVSPEERTRRAELAQETEREQPTLEVDSPEEVNKIELVPEREQANVQEPEHTATAELEPDSPEEVNKVEPVLEHEQVNVQEALERAALNRQRDRDQLDKDNLGQLAEGKRIDVENLSEKDAGQRDDNAQGELTGATNDYDSQQSTEREKNRQIELMEQVHQQFRVSGPKFHFKDQPGKLAFKDKGERMVSASNDERVAKAMATMAEAKGWKTIKVSGHPDFQKEVWMEASLRGLEVRGFKPSEQDLKLLEARRDRTLNNTVERDVDRERAAPRKPQARTQEQGSPERASSEPVSQRATAPIARNTGEGKPTPEQAASSALRAYSGKLLAHGADHYNHDKDEKMNYFVKLETAQGEKTVWGIDLKRAMEQGKPKVGDEINVEYNGHKMVEVEALKRDDNGKIIGRENIMSPRNEWVVEKSDKHKIVEAVAAKVIDAQVTDPAQRDQLRKAIDARLLERAQQGKIPTVKVYDKDAQGPQQDRTGPVVERNSERTR
jgi:hypothetical protein